MDLRNIYSNFKNTNDQDGKLDLPFVFLELHENISSLSSMIKPMNFEEENSGVDKKMILFTMKNIIRNLIWLCYKLKLNINELFDFDTY